MTSKATKPRSSPEHSFAAALDRLHPQGSLGVAVSGGPDSLALLILAAGHRPGSVEAATVDHGLREGSHAEAAAVAAICAGLGVPHEILKVSVAPGASLQSKARDARYAALAEWAGRRRLAAIATGHHADDQAETMLMRLSRGSGLRGLRGIQEKRALESGVELIRPLLSVRKASLAAFVAHAGLHAVDDPANHDPRHDRTQVRALLAAAPWLDPLRLVRSACALSEAEDVLAAAFSEVAETSIVAHEEGPGLTLQVSGVAREFRRRLLEAALARVGVDDLRGPELDHLLLQLERGAATTLRGFKISVGCEDTSWNLEPAPPRRHASRTAWPG